MITFQPNVDGWFVEMKDKLDNNSHIMANGCRIWQGGPKAGSYGQIFARLPMERSKKTQWVHRVAWMVANRAIKVPDGTEVSHLCHTGRCVEASHLLVEAHVLNQDRKSCKGRDCIKTHKPYCIDQVTAYQNKTLMFCLFILILFYLTLFYFLG